MTHETGNKSFDCPEANMELTLMLREMPGPVGALSKSSATFEHPEHNALIFLKVIKIV